MRSNSKLGRGLAIATVGSALLAPAASAAPIEQMVPSAANGEPSGHVDYSKNAAGGDYAPAVTSEAAPVRVAQVGADDRFDWADAGIGAGGLLALAAIVSGGLIAIRHRPETRHTVA